MTELTTILKKNLISVRALEYFYILYEVVNWK